MLKIARDFGWNLETFLQWGKAIRETFENDCLFTLSKKNEEANSIPMQMHAKQAVQLEEQGAQLNRQGILLGEQGAQLKRQGILLEEQGVQLKKQKTQLENQNILLQQLINVLTQGQNLDHLLCLNPNQDLALDIEDNQDLAFDANIPDSNIVPQLNCSDAILKLQNITSSCTKTLLLNVLKGKII